MHKELIETIPAMTSADYRQRFVAEFEQNRIRLMKLQELLRGYRNGTLSFVPACPISLLTEQYFLMRALDIVLARRACIENISLNVTEEKEDSNDKTTSEENRG